MAMSRSIYGDEPDLKLDVAPLLYIQAIFKDICLDGVIAISSCVSPWYLSILIPGKVS
jgi:hypothetical protein